MADCVCGHDTGTSEKIRAMFYDISPLGRQAGQPRLSTTGAKGKRKPTGYMLPTL